CRTTGQPGHPPARPPRDSASTAERPEPCGDCLPAAGQPRDDPHAAPARPRNPAHGAGIILLTYSRRAAGPSQNAVQDRGVLSDAGCARPARGAPISTLGSAPPAVNWDRDRAKETAIRTASA